MSLQAGFSAGSLVPFSGRGCSFDSSDKAIGWAVISCGLISYTQRYPMAGNPYERGMFPYGTCEASGFRAPLNGMVEVDGKKYISDFAPTPREAAPGRWVW